MTMEINLIRPSNSKPKRESKKTSPKKETTPKTPEEEVKDFIAEFNLESLLPQEFNGLDKGQKLKVIQDLKRRIVDIIKTDAQTQYSEDVKTKGIVGKLASSFLKEAHTEGIEKNIFEELKTSTRGRDIIYNDLRILTTKAQTQDVYISTDGKACVNYLKKEEGVEKKDKAFYTFLSKANCFAYMPYEWGQEKSGKNKKEYEKAKIEYEKARDEILKIKTEKEKPEEKGKAMLEILETDNVIKMEQLLNTHPEFEKVLENMTKDPSNIKTSAKFVGNLINTLRGKTWANTALMAGGYGARWGTKSLAVLAGGTTGIITAIAAPVIGGVVGGIRGKIRGNETLQERQKSARYGIKDESKEANKTIRADSMASHLEKIMGVLDNPSLTEEQRNIHLTRLKIRIDVTKSKIEQGLMDFGNSKVILINQFNLVNNLNKALVISASLEEKNKKEIDLRIEKLLSFRSNKIERRQKEFIKEQMLKGVRTGAAFATAGYLLHGIGEDLGWWGEHGTENFDSKQTETLTPEPVPDTQQPTAPVETLEAEVSQQEAPETIPETTPAQEPTATQDAPQDALAPATPEASPAVSEFTNKGITFEKSKGGIQGFLDLKEQIREQYHGDYSKAPKSVQDLMSSDHNAVEEAKKFGFYKPNGEESGLIREGSTLKFDNEGNLIFHDAKTGKDFTHYEGKMFDSDGSAKITTPEVKTEINVPQKSIALETSNQQIGFTPEIKNQEYGFTPATESDIAEQRAFIEQTQNTPSKPSPEELTKAIKDQLDAKEPAGTVHMGSTHHVGNQIHIGSQISTGSETHVGDNGYFRNIYGLDQFKDISHEDNLILERHPEFAENPYHLSGEKLIEVYETSNKDLSHVFRDAPSNWIDHLPKISEMSAGNVLEYEKQPSASMTANTLSGYLNILKNHAGLEPKSGFLGIGAESSKHYIARCLQVLAAGKGRDGLTLEIFEKNLRQ